MPLYPLIAAVSDRPMFAVALDGTILLWNPALERLLGISASDAVGQRCYQVLGACSDAERRACAADCPSLRSAARLQPRSTFQLCLVGPRQRAIHAEVSTVLMDRPRIIIHLIEPLPRLSREQAAPSLPEGATPLPDTLTGREAEVLHWLCLGATTEELADQLSISRATARNHIQHVIAKLGAHSRLEAVSRAMASRLEAAPD